MNKQLFLVIGIAVIVIALIVGVWFSFQKGMEEKPPVVPVKHKPVAQPKETELEYETESLSQDASDLEAIEKDKNLDSLDEDLSAVSEGEQLEQGSPKTPTGVDTSEIENLESEISDDLTGLTNDVTDLEGYEEDTSLNELDSSLSGF